MVCGIEVSVEGSPKRNISGAKRASGFNGPRSFRFTTRRKGRPDTRIPPKYHRERGMALGCPRSHEIRSMHSHARPGATRKRFHAVNSWAPRNDPWGMPTTAKMHPIRRKTRAAETTCGCCAERRNGNANHATAPTAKDDRRAIKTAVDVSCLPLSGWREMK